MAPFGTPVEAAPVEAVPIEAVLVEAVPIEAGFFALSTGLVVTLLVPGRCISAVFPDSLYS